MKRFKIEEPARKREFENILPMVNVVFLLLIFFMVAGAYSSPELYQVVTPDAASTEQANTRVLTVLMNTDGNLAIGQQQYSLQELLLHIQSEVAATAVKEVQIKADAEVDALQVVELIESLSQTELETVHLLTSAR